MYSRLCVTCKQNVINNVISWIQITEFGITDKAHAIHCWELPSFSDKLPVWVENQCMQFPGEITQPTAAPRSYLVEITSGEVHCNRSHLRVRLDNALNRSNDLTDHEPPNVIMT